MRTGPDGRVYVAQVSGSQISALDIANGGLETISAKGGDIIAPDDVAFDPHGNLYATEYYDGRVSVRGVDGRTRVLRDDLPGANGITIHRGRLFVNECRIGGRLMELDLNGGAPRVLLENLPLLGPMQFCYVPRPKLIRACRQELWAYVTGMAKLISTLSGFSVFGQDAVHRAQRAEVTALLKQRRKDLSGSEVGESRLMQDVEDGPPFAIGETTRRRGFQCLWAMERHPSAVIGRSGNAERRARRRDSKLPVRRVMGPPAFWQAKKEAAESNCDTSLARCT